MFILRIEGKLRFVRVKSVFCDEGTPPKRKGEILVKWLLKNRKYIRPVLVFCTIAMGVIMLTTIATPRWHFYLFLGLFLTVLSWAYDSLCKREEKIESGTAKVWWKDFDFVWGMGWFMAYFCMFVYNLFLIFTGQS